MLFDGNLNCLESKEILICVEIVGSTYLRVLGDGERERWRGGKGER